jgi:tetratricopeptide (TPR) repeat protein
MAKSTEEAMGFIKSASALILVGIFAFIVFFPRSPEVPPVTDDLIEKIQLGKRDSMRRAALVAKASMENTGEYNFGNVTNVKPPPAPTPEAPVFEPNAGKVDPVITAGGIDPEVQAAIDMIDNGDIQAAVVKLEEILKKDPKNEQALVEMAMIQLLDLKQPGKAIDYLQRVVDVNPSNRIVMNELVSLYEEEGRSDEGLAYMQSIAEANPESGELAYGIGQMLAMQGRDEEAIPHLEKASRNDADNFRAQKELAEAYSRAGQSDKSIQAYKQALARQDQDLQSRTDQGLPTTFARERLGYTKLDLARELINAGRFDEAQKEIDFAKDAVPDGNAISAAQNRLDARRG